MNYLPIYDNQQTLAFESEWMQKHHVDSQTLVEQAGEGIGQAILRDLSQVALSPDPLRLLLLVGNGNNGADALVAADTMVKALGGRMNITIIAPKYKNFSTLTNLLYKKLTIRCSEFPSLKIRTINGGDFYSEPWFQRLWTVCLDGLYGLRSPKDLDHEHSELLRAVNAHPRIQFRAAVDIPSGVSDECVCEDAFRADVTYVTGVMKRCLLEPGVSEKVGRLQFVDIQFFLGLDENSFGKTCVVGEGILGPLRHFRPVFSDKRDYGHVLFVGGSRAMPGAALMALHGVLRSGTGLLTACVPETVAGHLCAQVPEAMWRFWPETEVGQLALEGVNELVPSLSDYSSIVMGPGAGRSKETQVLFGEILKHAGCPVVCDADALQPSLLPLLAERGKAGLVTVLTPHHGECKRVFGDDLSPEGMAEKAVASGCYIVLKGPHTRVYNAKEAAIREVISPWASPVLARGGSGDVFAGLLGGLLAQKHEDIFHRICQAVCWQAVASRELACFRGERAVRTTDILDCFSTAIRR